MGTFTIIRQQRSAGGRWLPWTPPVFPVRKKNRIRLARIEFRNTEAIAAWFDASESKYYTWSVLHLSELHWVDKATVIQWLTPEYEDELTGITHE